MAEMDREKCAKALAEKANECCYRSDGYEEELEKLILAALETAYEDGRLTESWLWMLGDG